MTWVPWFYSAVLVVNMVATVWMAKICRDMRRENTSVWTELRAARAFINAILERTVGTIVCDGCGNPIVADQHAAIRITPDGSLFGHTMCLPPMPEKS